MTDSLPPQVIVTELADGIRYRLPLRKRGGFVWMGLGHLVGGIVGIVFVSFWLYGVGYHINWRAPFDGPEGFLLLFLAFGLFMLTMILGATSQGITRLVGHSEIEVRGEMLRGFECWGPLRFGWRRPLAGLARFEVRHSALEKDAIKAYASASEAFDHHVILPVWETDEVFPPNKWKRLAWGYPRDWLVPLAHHLARRCRLTTIEGLPSLASPPPPVPVTAELLPNEAGFVEHFAQPPGSKFVVQQSEWKLHLNLPGKLALLIEGDVLRVEQRKAFRTRVHSWSQKQLAEIRVGKDVDSEGPDTPVLLIRPHPGEGDLVRVSLPDEAEARWLATLLRQTLALDDGDWKKPGGPFRERSEPPAGSSIMLRRTTATLKLTVPTVSILHRANRNHYLSALIIALLAGVIGVTLLFAPNNALFQIIGTPLCNWVFGFTVLLTFVFLGHALYVSQQRLEMLVVGDGLHVERSTLLGTTQQHWLRSSIADVRVGYHLSPLVPRQLRQTLYDSGGLRWELQIHLEHGETVGLLEDYPPQELQWVATLLRRELGLPRLPVRDRG